MNETLEILNMVLFTQAKELLKYINSHSHSWIG